MVKKALTITNCPANRVVVCNLKHTIQPGTTQEVSYSFPAVEDEGLGR